MIRPQFHVTIWDSPAAVTTQPAWAPRDHVVSAGSGERRRLRDGRGEEEQDDPHEDEAAHARVVEQRWSLMTWLVALPGLSVSVTDCNALCPIQHAPAIALRPGRSFGSLVSGMAASLSSASATIADCPMVWPREVQGMRQMSRTGRELVPGGLTRLWGRPHTGVHGWCGDIRGGSAGGSDSWWSFAAPRCQSECCSSRHGASVALIGSAGARRPGRGAGFPSRPARSGRMGSAVRLVGRDGPPCFPTVPRRLHDGGGGSAPRSWGCGVRRRGCGQWRDLLRAASWTGATVGCVAPDGLGDPRHCRVGRACLPRGPQGGRGRPSAHGLMRTRGLGCCGWWGVWAVPVSLVVAWANHFLLGDQTWLVIAALGWGTLSVPLTVAAATCATGSSTSGWC